MAEPATISTQNAQLIFDQVWKQLQTRSGQACLTFPSQVVWLGGAPGAGKGTHTRTVMERLKITAEPIVMSALLTSPEMQAIKAAGKLVGDPEVLGALMAEMAQPKYRSGVVIDGFPRTRVQAKCVQLLHGAIQSQGTKPDFKIVVLHVTEDEAVSRQLGRGREIVEHNRKVKETGKGQLQELRPTDTDEKLCRERYQVFVAQTLDALKFMAESFPYYQIDANGAKEQTRANTIKALG